MHLIKEMDVWWEFNMYLYEPLVCQGSKAGSLGNIMSDDHLASV